MDLALPYRVTLTTNGRSYEEIHNKALRELTEFFGEELLSKVDLSIDSVVLRQGSWNADVTISVFRQELPPPEPKLWKVIGLYNVNEIEFGKPEEEVSAALLRAHIQTEGSGSGTDLQDGERDIEWLFTTKELAEMALDTVIAPAVASYGERLSWKILSPEGTAI